MNKECKHHGLTEHTVRADGRVRCKRCAIESVQKRRKKLKILSIEYKGGSCEVCGYDKCTRALEFHHQDPNEKDFGIAAKGYTRSWEKVKEELDKCIMVCANCHAELHHNLELGVFQLP